MLTITPTTSLLSDMQILTTAKEIKDYTSKRRLKTLKIGFIPTMGALHSGHISLIEASKRENDVTICSVFVNPTQFNEPADFQNYPRQIESDLKMLESAGCDAAFTPHVNQVYPVPDTTIYDLGEVALKLEGKQRPGHFNGVASVVKRFLDLVQPHNAYFGLKDYQQFLVIKNLAEQYNLNVNIVGCPIVREDSGLAKSSRNQLLSADSKRVASDIYKSLELVKKSASEHGVKELAKIGLTYLESKEGIDPEYFVVVDALSLDAPTAGEDNGLIALVAAWVDGVRLIDNMLFKTTK